MKRILMICLMICCIGSTAFAAFDKSGPSILIGEVACYGENELLPEFVENFKDVLASELNETNKYQVDTSRFGAASDEDEIFSMIHMDAIAHSHLYRRELANAKMIRYGDSVMGRQYYQDEAKTAQRMKLEGQPYSLSPNVTAKVIELGQQYNADYMLFVNLRDVDVWRKHGGIFGTHTTTEQFRGKKALFELEFYLINTKTGKVFEGQNAEKKTSLVSNILISKYGNNFTIQEMVQTLIAAQSQQIIKTINNKGIKTIGG